MSVKYSLNTPTQLLELTLSQENSSGAQNISQSPVFNSGPRRTFGGRWACCRPPTVGPRSSRCREKTQQCVMKQVMEKRAFFL